MNEIEDNISLFGFSVQNTNSENLLVDQDSLASLMVIRVLITCCLIIYWHSDEKLGLDNFRVLMD